MLTRGDWPAVWDRQEQDQAPGGRGHVHRDALALLAGAAVASQPGAYVSVDDWRLELDLFSFDNQKLVFTYILFIPLLRGS